MKWEAVLNSTELNIKYFVGGRESEGGIIMVYILCLGGN